MAGSLLVPERIRTNQSRLSPGQRRVARFCLSQPVSASELAAARIGHIVGVSESTVVRLALTLGYDGFPELQQAIRDALKPIPAVDTAGNAAVPAAARAMFDADMRNVTELTATLDLMAVARAADLLDRSGTIFVVGFRSSFSVAYLASFLIQQVHPQARLMADSGGSLANDVAAMSPGDAVIAISFPRYVRKTVQVVEYAIEHGLDVVAITDSFLSPIATADVVFSAPHEAPSFFNSHVSAVILVNALVAELADRAGGRSTTYQRNLTDTFYELVGPNGKNA